MREYHLTVPERLAVLETKADKAEKDNAEIMHKLDDLLAIRNKGAGIFWLISALVGTGIIGLVASLLSIFKH